MNRENIYFIGKPYPYKEAKALIRRAGYGVGLLHDINVPLFKPGDYDDVIDVDFSSEATVLASLPAGFKAGGLVCTYENYIMAKAQLGKHLGLPAISAESAAVSTDKYLMRQAFMAADPAITPQFGLVASRDEALALASRLNYPLILKPTNLVKSLLVLRCDNQSELLKNFDYAQARVAELYKKYQVYDRQPQLILEEYITGKTCSIAAFVDQAGQPHFCDGIVGLTTAQEIGRQDNFIYERCLPADFDPKLTQKFFDVAAKGIAALKLTSTPAHVELIYNQNEVKLIEIGARIGGYRPRMYSISYGLDLIDQEIKLALGQPPELQGSLTDYSAVFELFPEAEGKFQAIEGEADTAAFRRYSVKPKPGDLIGPAQAGYKAAAVIIVSSPDQAEFNDLRTQAGKLKVVTI